MSKYKEVLKHSATYGVATVLGRVASLLLLPIYTRFLAPQDYGIIALLDATSAVLVIVMLSGVVQAVTRHHFTTEDVEIRRRLWWTSLSIVSATSCIIAAPVFVFGSSISTVILGPRVTEGPLYVKLQILILCVSSIEALLQVYLRVRKWSVTFLVISLFRLMLNVALNISFLLSGMGIAAILLGNLATSALCCVTLFVFFLNELGSIRFSWLWAVKLYRYGGPLVVTGLLGFVMHQSDRFVLRYFVPLEDLGIYSLAYNISYGLYMLMVTPFLAIWDVTKFEVSDQPEATEVYSRVFQLFLSALITGMLGLSIIILPLLKLICPVEYWPAAELVPAICMAYWFCGANIFFSIPATTENRTSQLMPASLAAAGVNFVANLMLIPIWGVYGAAMATAITFMALGMVNYVIGRRIRFIPYSFGNVAITLVSASLIYVMHKFLLSVHVSLLWLYLVTTGAFALFVVVNLWQSNLMRILAAAPRAAE